MACAGEEGDGKRERCLKGDDGQCQAGVIAFE